LKDYDDAAWIFPLEKNFFLLSVVVVVVFLIHPAIRVTPPLP